MLSGDRIKSEPDPALVSWMRLCVLHVCPTCLSYMSVCLHKVCDEDSNKLCLQNIFQCTKLKYQVSMFVYTGKKNFKLIIYRKVKFIVNNIQASKI